MELWVTGATAALFTLFDLDRTFYVPSKAERKAVLYAWWWGFVLANSGFAVVAYEIVGGNVASKISNPWLRAISVGAGYLAVIRSKLTTISYQGKEIPFGPEFLYEGMKAFVFKRINNIAKRARSTETAQMAAQNTLAQLVSQAKLDIEQDQLLSAEEKRLRKAWVLRVFQDANASDEDKRATLADYLLSGQRSSDIA
jgi:hypothetical protein